MDEKLVFQIKDPGTGEFTSRRLTNQEAPLYPDYINKELALAVGRDRFNDPLMRISWGQRLFRIVNGQKLMLHPCQSWKKNGEVYQVGFPRFIVQQKMDPVFVGLDTWDEKVQGPKPRKGMYVFLACVQTIDGKFKLPDRILLEALKGLDFNKRHETLYGSHMDQVPEEASKWKLQEMLSQIEEKEKKYVAEQKDIARQVFKGRINRILSSHPNEGKTPDPYRLAQKQRAEAIIARQNVLAGKASANTSNKKVILTDFI